MDALLWVGLLMAADPELETQDRRLDAVLAEAQTKARTWHYAWIGIYGGLAATQATLAATADNPEDRQRGAYAAVPTTVGIGFSLIRPIKSLQAVKLGEAVDALHADDVAARLRAKRALIERLAKSERAASGWLPRIAGFALNLAAAGAIWAATDEITPAAIQLGVGTVSNELKLQTAPRTMRSEVKGFASPVLGFKF